MSNRSAIQLAHQEDVDHVCELMYSLTVRIGELYDLHAQQKKEIRELKNLVLLQKQERVPISVPVLGLSS